MGRNHGQTVRKHRAQRAVFTDQPITRPPRGPRSAWPSDRYWIRSRAQYNKPATKKIGGGEPSHGSKLKTYTKDNNFKKNASKQNSLNNEQNELLTTRMVELLPPQPIALPHRARTSGPDKCSFWVPNRFTSSNKNSRNRSFQSYITSTEEKRRK